MNRTVIKARDVMHARHLELDGMATVAEALSAMREAKSEVLIVKKRNENDAFGIVLLADIAREVLARDRSAERVNVYEIMSKPVISVEPDMDVRYVARMFQSFGLANAPVIENGRVIGIVSYSELVFEGLCKLID
ncbi:CBS domain-containing protein [Seongchinamella sediminis]|uniref:CBS domain-containing protein n=1 Tax=Seongchinamella sediminis TaxID=2283635 RepID=A0A3L7E396_9GAMM|nr:CBS domain-containing protein [Seongchinamella sediminis]RLQ23310.1 CBS domain-containing protein [Seongchinamella sediminis]